MEGEARRPLAGLLRLPDLRGLHVEYFASAGFRAVSVHGTSEKDRGSALEELEAGTLDVIFSVDLFNEGLDLPALDTVIMLRPTESSVLFLEHLGRGLRGLHEGPASGNHGGGKKHPTRGFLALY